MSIFSDHECGALSDFEFDQECRRMNRQDRYEREHLYDEEWNSDKCDTCAHLIEREKADGQMFWECNISGCEYEEADQAYTESDFRKKCDRAVAESGYLDQGITPGIV